MMRTNMTMWCGLLGCALLFSGCQGIREHVRSKDFRQAQPAFRDNMTPSPIANVVDMPGWTTDVDGAVAFATENPQNTVLFVQQNGNPQTDAMKKILVSSEAETALSGKQKVTLNMASSPDVVARYGVRQAPAVVILGPGGVPASQKAGRVSKSELVKFLK